ncbi:MAG TPA: nuclear transport factor 2 family protein [Candidatus Polarisedimenticolia bacterium]|nr:nuclear transport factor 2 family protein [Candidatus Polarisedimenticolia bacterium]
MGTKKPKAVVLEFIDKINGADVDGLCALMTDDHVFVDALGNRVRGREGMRAGWKGYFTLFPDYRITHEEVFQNRETVAVFGTASGTYAAAGKPSKEHHWQVPAAWKAVIRDAKVAEWRVYCDNQAARKLLGDKTP